MDPSRRRRSRPPRSAGIGDLLILHADVDEIHHGTDHQQYGRQRQRGLNGGDPARAPNDARGRCRGVIGSEPIAGAVHGMDDSSTQFAAQVMHIGVDDARRVGTVECRAEAADRG